MRIAPHPLPPAPCQAAFISVQVAAAAAAAEEERSSSGLEEMEKAVSMLASIFRGASSGTPEPPAAAVASIFVYPIKSCRGISVPQACVTSTGFRWDRQWMIVNSKRRAYTQRVEPKLALVEVEMPMEAFSEGWEPKEDSYLAIKAPGMELLKVPLNRTCGIIDGVSVWEWTGSAFDEGAEASEWFSDYLGKPSHLVRFNSGLETRAVDPNYACGYKTMFSDGFPFLLISQGSLSALNQLLKDPLSIDRFRPNVLIDGCEPFSEDLWTVLRINKLTFHGVKLCSRCKVPTINQETGVAGIEPTETLMKFRSDCVLRPDRKQQGKVYFGQNLICKESLSSTKGKIVKRIESGSSGPMFLHFLNVESIKTYPPDKAVLDVIGLALGGT